MHEENNKFKKLNVYRKNDLCGILSYDGKLYTFIYEDGYKGDPISLTMPVSQKKFEYEDFPPFFDGLLPEGHQLEGLLKLNKIDKFDYMKQLAAVGQDMIGVITVSPVIVFKNSFLSENEV